MPTVRRTIDFTKPQKLSKEAKERFDALKDEDIDFSDIPEITDEMWENAVIMRPEDWKKRQLTLRLDPDIIDFFKAQGKGYQTRMNNVLRAYVDAVKKS